MTHARTPRPLAHALRWTSLLSLSMLAAGCSVLPVLSTSSAPSYPPSPNDAATSRTEVTAAASRPDPSGLKPFQDVIRGATEDDGFFPVWRKDEKAWIEIPESAWNRPFLLTINVASSVGQQGLYASQMGRSWMAQFRRIGNQVQLIAKNVDYRAGTSPSLQQAVAEGFSDSLLGATPVVSALHPERKSVLIDATFLLGDIAGYSTTIESAFKLAYAFDRTNSFFERSSAEPDLTTLAVRMHFATSRIPASSSSGVPPTVTPDPRSFFVGFVYNFVELPEQPMRPRLADARIGHFTESFTDVAAELRTNSRVHYINRWRLEKKDELATISEPRQPIVFWLDKNIPTRYRAAVEAGVLEWNKAFERIGFRDAIVVRQQPDDASWNNMDARHASIRWYMGSDAGTARGPHHADPRTGEILDADISLPDIFARSARRFIVEEIGQTSDQRLAALTSQWREATPGAAGRGPIFAQCDYASEAAAEMDFALDSLIARGDIAADGPQADVFVQGVIKDVVMHEVGHTLGLKHNFKASTTITRAQLEDRGYTELRGISGSVMDYNGYNLALKGQPQGAYSATTLGPYDYWAIEYAYRTFPAEREGEELQKIAARSNEPQLAYGDDYDAGGFAGFEGIDPTVNRFDLGDDPLAFYEKRLKLSQELWLRLQMREPQVGDDPARARRVLLNGFSQLRSAADLTAKYVGGVMQVRDLPGSTTRRTFTPVDPAKQRQALQFLTTNLFSADNFRFRPEFLRSLPPDYLDRNAPGPVPLPAVVLNLQSTAMDRLLSSGTASRVMDLPNYVSSNQRAGVLGLQEVYRTVQDAVWSELNDGKGGISEISPLRRNLQREHLKRVVSALTRSSSMPPDALSLMRFNATRLSEDLRRATAVKTVSVETQAHLQDSQALLAEALRASIQRQ